MYVFPLQIVKLNMLLSLYKQHSLLINFVGVYVE